MKTYYIVEDRSKYDGSPEYTAYGSKLAILFNDYIVWASNESSIGSCIQRLQTYLKNKNFKKKIVRTVRL